MYLSCLLIDVGTNPDRPRPGRLWLRNLYRVHQRLYMAFPSVSRKSGDPVFLEPYNPKDFGPEQVHVPRGVDNGFLFRIDPQSEGRVVILVQSAVEPDWDYAFHNARYLLAAPPEWKEIDPCFTEGQRLRFRLVANPTRRLSRNSFGADGRPIEKGLIGKRVPVPNDKLNEWLVRKAEQAGLSVEMDSLTVQQMYIYVNKEGNGGGNRLLSVRYEGCLRVTDPSSLQESLIKGIGPGKAFGFGLLSVAPYRSPS